MSPDEPQRIDPEVFAELRAVERKPLVIQLAESTPLLVFVAFLIVAGIYAALRFTGHDDDGPFTELLLLLGGGLLRGRLVGSDQAPR